MATEAELTNAAPVDSTTPDEVALALSAAVEEAEVELARLDEPEEADAEFVEVVIPDEEEAVVAVADAAELEASVAVEDAAAAALELKEELTEARGSETPGQSRMQFAMVL